MPALFGVARRLATTLALCLVATSPTPSQSSDRLAEAARLSAAARAALERGDTAAAAPDARRALELYEAATGPDSRETGIALIELGDAHYYASELDPAQAAYARALAVLEKALGPDAYEVSVALEGFVVVYYARGGYKDAIPFAERMLAIREKAPGPKPASMAEALTNTAALYLGLADHEKAATLLTRALAEFERALGPDDPSVIAALNNLAVLQHKLSRYAEAAALYARGIAAVERAGGPDQAALIPSLLNLGKLHRELGEYDDAEAVLRRALALVEKTGGPEHLAAAQALDALGTVKRQRADYPAARPFYERALVIYEKAVGPGHHSVGTLLANLAVLDSATGDVESADRRFARSVAVLEKALGPEHPDVLAVVANQADVFRAAGEHDRAARLYERAVAAHERAGSPDRPRLAKALEGLATSLLKRDGDSPRVETLLRRSLDLRTEALGADHPAVASSLVSLGLLARERRDFARAEQALTRALEIAERAFGGSHPDTANAAGYLSEIFRASGDLDRAVAFLRRASDTRERDFGRNLAAGSERQKLLYLETSARELSQSISLALGAGPAGRAARELAFETVLRRKGRALDAAAQGVDVLRRRGRPEDRALLTELADARAKLSAATLAGPGARQPADLRAELDRLQRLVDDLESRVGARFAQFRAATRHVTAADVRAAIPEGAVLVEIAGYFPYDPKTRVYGARRYAAYAAGRDGEVRSVDLGDAAEIDALAGRLRTALRDRRASTKPAARALDERVMRPVRALTGAATHLLVSPDGELNLVPFAALVDERGELLLERYTFTYLASGRDLLREPSPSTSGEPLIVADPDFGGGAATAATRSVRLRPSEQGEEPRLFFPRLPGTATEAQAIARLLGTGRTLTGARATKQALFEASGPSVLHVATHGFFLDTGEADAETRTVRLLNGQPGAPAASSAAAALMRSGLALAGANDGPGVLTALEASSLDLRGTRLVVLSACDTGVGAVRAGDGVYGLRRALVLAGSESQLLSLWPVSDSRTRELMTAYYGALRAGKGRGEALREVQLAMARDPRTRHPFNWAGFIHSGDWRPVQLR